MLRKETDTSSVRVEPPPPAPVGCPTCGAAVDARSRHVVVQGSSVRVFCSRECKEGGLLDDLGLVLEAEPQGGRRRLALGIAGVGALFIAVGAPLGLWLLGQGVASGPGADAGALGARVEAADAPSPDAEPMHMGPAWPPTEQEWIDMLARDTWIHPLAGPVRRMPSRHSRVFGAARAGDRPAECKNGHCGVDLGGAADWGEPVLAVHEGVVERVERGPNPHGGGRWVRLSHRQGTVFTEYFHLAAIPRHIRPGRRVEMGEMIGLLGETGIQNSGPHLHFTLLVKPAEDVPTQFVDPEPLIALWPLKIPVQCSDESLVSPLEPPGFVRGAASGRKRRKHSKKRKARTERELAAAGKKEAAPEEPEEPEPPEPPGEKNPGAGGQ